MNTTILIVDDEPEIRALIGTILIEYVGEEFLVTARDGREALEMLSEHAVRLVITDWDMPVLNGIQLTERIKEGWPQRYEEAMKRFLARRPRTLKTGGQYPGREEVHERSLLR